MPPLRNRTRAYAQPYAPFNWRAAFWASVIGALVFAVFNIGLNWALRGLSPWIPLRMIAAMVLGQSALSPPDTFDAGILLVAVLVHLGLSIAYGTFLALVIPRLRTAAAIMVGGFYGLGLYYINFYGFNAFSPWFGDTRDWLNIASHFLFGAVLACAYTAINKGVPSDLVEPSSTEPLFR
jgi:hypothetical protein